MVLSSALTNVFLEVTPAAIYADCYCVSLLFYMQLQSSDGNSLIFM